MKNKNNFKKKLLPIVLAMHLVLGPISLNTAYAEEVPSTPQAPSAPTAPTAPSVPNVPTAPTPPNSPTAPTPPTAPTGPSVPNQPVAPTAPVAPTPSVSQTQNNTDLPQITDVNPTPTQGNADGNVGDTLIVTGDGNSDTTASTLGNNNLSTNSGSGTGNSASVSNQSNGAGSNNNGSANIVNSDDTNQANSAQVANTLDSSTVTGGNSASFNVGNSSIHTGDANVSGTLLTSVNTNVDGIAIAEFNIADDHVGDYYLDFNAGCISGCFGQSVANNSNNGAYSNNNSNVQVTNLDNTNQTNDAGIDNTLNLVADSGNNNANFNTGGDSAITTGDANVSANVLNFANNNLAGNVVYSTVNVYGDLYGDIILTQEAMNAFCGNCMNSNSVSNSGNGANSNNNAASNQTNTNNTAQFNNAEIDNNLVFDANTGNNDANANTDGNNAVLTGNANVDATVLNIANTNIETGGNAWLVLVNQAGKWLGHIIGADGSPVAGSEGFEFTVDNNGNVSASNSGNGAHSNNDNVVTESNTSNTTQTNNANVQNNINLSANTGDNSATFNTGGNSTIQTGDANIVANIVNFVNTNIVSSGKLFVTVVNVFGTWAGDFITPDSPAKAENSSETSNNVGGYQNSENQTQSTLVNETGISENNAYTTDGQTTSTPAYVASRVQNAVNGNSSSVASATISNEEKIAFGQPTQVAGVDKINNTIKVNLAWLLILVPAYMMVTIGRKKKILSFLKVSK